MLVKSTLGLFRAYATVTFLVRIIVLFSALITCSFCTYHGHRVVSSEYYR